MTFLLSLWVASLAVMIVIGAIAYRRGGGEMLPSHGAMTDLLLFMREEIGALYADGRMIADTLHPHARRFFVGSLTVVRKGQNVLVEKAFGRIAAPKGKTSSFFLKRIAEHKDANRREET